MFINHRPILHACPDQSRRVPCLHPDRQAPVVISHTSSSSAQLHANAQLGELPYAHAEHKQITLTLNAK